MILVNYKKHSVNEIKLIFTNMQLTINDVEGCKPNIIVFFDTDTLRFAENYSFYLT